jgi:hypothetical protein
LRLGEISNIVEFGLSEDRRKILERADHEFEERIKCGILGWESNDLHWANVLTDMSHRLGRWSPGSNPGWPLPF